MIPRFFPILLLLQQLGWYEIGITHHVACRLHQTVSQLTDDCFSDAIIKKTLLYHGTCGKSWLLKPLPLLLKSRRCRNFPPSLCHLLFFDSVAFSFPVMWKANTVREEQRWEWGINSLLFCTGYIKGSMVHS